MSKPKKFWADTSKAHYLKTDSDIEFMYLKPIYLKSKNTRRKSILTRNKVKRDMEKFLKLMKDAES